MYIRRMTPVLQPMYDVPQVGIVWRLEMLSEAVNARNPVGRVNVNSQFKRANEILPRMRT